MNRDQLAAIMAHVLTLLRQGEAEPAADQLADTLDQLEAEDAARDDAPPPWSVATYFDDCPF
jgi:hypothetical protein